jgi:hypothetical protein
MPSWPSRSCPPGSKTLDGRACSGGLARAEAGAEGKDSLMGQGPGARGETLGGLARPSVRLFCFFLSSCRLRSVIMIAMKTRPEPRRRLEDAQAPLPHQYTPPDSNLAFLRALADALRDILRDERGAAS